VHCAYTVEAQIVLFSEDIIFFFVFQIGLEQGFPTFSPSRTTWAPCIVNAYHFFQNNQFDRILVYSEE